VSIRRTGYMIRNIQIYTIPIVGTGLMIWTSTVEVRENKKMIGGNRE